jgi:hypothetical protein
MKLSYSRPTALAILCFLLRRSAMNTSKNRHRPLVGVRLGRIAVLLGGILLSSAAGMAQGFPKPPPLPTPPPSARTRVFARGLQVPDLATLNKQIQTQGPKAAELLRLDSLAQGALPPNIRAALPGQVMRQRLPAASVASFDWTPLIPAWPVKDQGDCGSCFIFAATGIFEASYFIRNGVRITASEQSLLDRTVNPWVCEDSKRGGGWSAEPLTQLMTFGDASQATYPYSAVKGTPRPNVPMPYRAMVWGFVGNVPSPSVAQIKQALLDHGPLVLGVRADKGHLSESLDLPGNESNHAVTLVGWNDVSRTWKIRNSWGTGYGENGYGTVPYSLEGHGLSVLWVDALCDKYALPAAAQKIVDDVRQFFLGGVKALPMQFTVMGGFDADVLGFHLKLDSGSIQNDAQKSTLTGTVSVWRGTDQGTRLTFENATIIVTKSGAAMTGFSGGGGLKVTVQGQQVALGNGATVACTASGQLTGKGHLQALSHTFDVTYALSGSGLSADGRWNGGETGWHDVPGLRAEYQVKGPQVVLALRNAMVTTTFSMTKVEARSKDSNPISNQPWASGSLSNLNPGISSQGDFTLPLPSLPQPGDVNKKARDLCREACPPSSPITDRDGCLRGCDSAFPSPPGMPNLRPIVIRWNTAIK